MPPSRPVPPLESLLVHHAGWLRSLALCLAGNRDEADDLVQQTWVAAAESPPDPRQPVRPWLAEVMRNFRRMRLRASARRRARELHAAGTGTAVSPTDVLLEQLELQRLVARLLGELEEPYRTAILLRFHEGHPASRIAAEQGIPAGTVRWRLSEGLRRLRQRLDDAHGGKRAAWAALVTAGPGPSGRASGVAGGSALAGGPPLWLGAGVMALGLLTGLVAIALREPAHLLGDPGRAAATAAAGPTNPGAPTNPTPGPQPVTKEDPMMREKVKMAVALFGTALPALVAGADQGGKPLPREELIAVCVEFKEKALVCKEELADHFAAFAPPERREKIRAKALQEIVQEGSGPLEPRQKKCAEDVDPKGKKPMSFGALTEPDVAALRICEKETDCKKRVECGMAVLNEAGRRARR
jgi:RNA polymerase sigma factor (sigma-70 family)